MYTLLILFFASLLGIILMIGKKLLMLQNGQILQNEETAFKTPFFEEWKYLTARSIKKHGYNSLVATIRFYVKATVFLKSKYQEAKIRLESMQNKLNKEEKREVSGFLKMISEYKKKIREIKHKIKQEENL